MIENIIIGFFVLGGLTIIGLIVLLYIIETNGGTD